jgi:hypothetical protein
MSRLNLRTNRVQSSFKTLQRKLTVLLRRVNAEAAAQMKAGRYDTATALMDIGRSFSEFSTKTDECSKAWDQVAAHANSKLADLGLPTGPSHKKLTPPKALCIPALQIVVKHGGHADMADVVSDIGNSCANWTDGDLAQLGGGPRWHASLDKAYRRSQKKGWIAKRSDGVWEITDKGRAALDEHDPT